MPKLIRFGVSLDKVLLDRFDRHIRNRKYTNRSEAIRDLIREIIVKEEWKKGGEVAGAIVLVYDHHKRELINMLTDIQHDYGEIIISTQHVHLDHNNCLEVVAVKGSSARINDLYNTLRAAKGVKHGSLNMTTIGRDLV